MSKIFSTAMCALTIALGITALSSCSNDKAKQAVTTDAEQLNTKLGKIMAGAPEAVSDFNISANDTNVAVKATIKPAAFDLKLLDSVLVDFALASYLHADGGADSDVADLINNMSKAEMPMELTLSQDGTDFKLTRTGAQLKALNSTDLSSLNRATAASKFTELLAGKIADKFKTDAATDFQCTFMAQVIEVTITYPKKEDSYYGKLQNAASVLKGDMITFVDNYIGQYGSLAPAMNKLMSDLGIAKLHIIYKDAKDETFAGAYYEF